MNTNNDSNSEWFVSWERFHQDTKNLVQQIMPLHKAQPWQGVIGIARGGLIPATIIARELDIRLVDSLAIASYSHQQQGDVAVLKSVTGDGAGMLIVDDLVDTGITAEVAQKLLPKACFVSVYAKPKAIKLAQYFAVEVAQNTWIHFPWDGENGTYTKPLINQ